MERLRSVRTCTLVPFPQELGKNDWVCQWMAICPTMRRPGIVTWDREVVYECVWRFLFFLFFLARSKSGIAAGMRGSD